MAREQGDRPHDAILDAVRDRADWDDDRRSEALGELIARFEPDDLARAIHPRLASLGGRDGATLIELVEGLARPDLLASLADAVAAQPDLAPDVAWLALDVLEGTGLVDERPELRMLRDELDDLEEGEDPLEDLAAQIAGDPGSALVAAEGLSRVEPAIRREIIEGLGRRADAEPIRAFLRLLAEGGDPVVIEEVRAALGEDSPPSSGLSVFAPRTYSRLIGSAVGPIDGEGRASILVRSVGEDAEVVAQFACDVQSGIVAGGLVETGADVYAEAVSDLGPGTIVDHHPLAVLLLGASTWLSGDAIPDAAREALLVTLGPDLDPHPILSANESIGSSAHLQSAGEDARLVLSNREGWLDDSPLLRELAVAWAMREEASSPDIGRDPGPFRVLFEGRMLARIELYRRMLLWSALAWEADGDEDLAGAARRLAAQLGEPQNAVPGHPFLSELMTRSLEAAM